MCRLTLLASQCHSLKDKRSVVRKLKERVRTRCQVALGEVGAQDTWQRLVLGFAVVSSDRQTVERMLGEIAQVVAGAGLAELIHEERELLAYGEGPMGEAAVAMANKTGASDDMDSMDDDWIPDSWKSEEVP